jgi:hypothetical protein
MVALGRAWSAAEDAALRAGYLKRGCASVASELGRSFASVAKRAARLGIASHRRWTKQDDDTLRDLWGHYAIGRLASELRRTRAAIFWRAMQLDLDAGAPEGLEYLTQSAQRVGFATATLRRILAWHGVPLQRSRSRLTKAKRHYHVVDPDCVNEAVAAWLEAEEIHPAARARGISGETLKRWLLDARAHGFKMSPPPAGKKFRWRVPGSTIDKVIAWRKSHETLSQACERTGVKRPVLTHWLTLEQVPRRSVKPWLVPIAEVDRIVAERRESEAA